MGRLEEYRTTEMHDLRVSRDAIILSYRASIKGIYDNKSTWKTATHETAVAPAQAVELKDNCPQSRKLSGWRSVGGSHPVVNASPQRSTRLRSVIAVYNRDVLEWKVV